MMISVHGVLVIGETPSLGRAIFDLLEAENLHAKYLSEQLDASRIRDLLSEFPVVVVASNALYCSTGRFWLRGELSGAHLIVVGCRDPLVADAKGVLPISLPIPAVALMDAIKATLREVANSALGGESTPYGPPAAVGWTSTYRAPSLPSLNAAGGEDRRSGELNRPPR